MTNAPSSGWKRGRFGENLSVTPAACHLPYRGEALAYRKAFPLRQRLPYKGSCLRSRLRGWIEGSLPAEKPLRHACGVPPPLSRGGFGIPQSFPSSPEAPLQGELSAKQTERLDRGKPARGKTSPSRLRRATSPIEGRLWHTVKLSLFARGSPTRGNGDDRRQRRKQGGAVGAAASRMQATAKQTLGAATRSWRAKQTERLDRGRPCLEGREEKLPGEA